MMDIVEQMRNSWRDRANALRAWVDAKKQALDKKTEAKEAHDLACESAMPDADEMVSTWHEFKDTNKEQNELVRKAKQKFEEAEKKHAEIMEDSRQERLDFEDQSQ